jgi:hypothetical protein
MKDRGGMMRNMGEWLTIVTSRVANLVILKPSQNSDGKKKSKKGKEDILRVDMIGTAGMED